MTKKSVKTTDFIPTCVVFDRSVKASVSHLAITENQSFSKTVEAACKQYLARKH